MIFKFRRLIRKLFDCIGIAGNKVKFDAQGDGIGHYDIYQYQNDNGHFKYVPIGSCQPINESHNILNISKELLKWTNYKPGIIPRSICNEPCGVGYITTFTNEKCCWFCLKCHDYQIEVNNTCIDCELGFMPDSKYSTCMEIESTYIEWLSLWFLIPTILATIGILATLTAFFIFAYYNKTPIIKASGRELCYIMFVGIFLCYVMTFITMAKPTIPTCAIFRCGNGFSLSLIYAAIFTKTNRLSRIFNRGIKAMMKRPSYTSPKSQVYILNRNFIYIYPNNHYSRLV